MRPSKLSVIFFLSVFLYSCGLGTNVTTEPVTESVTGSININSFQCGQSEKYAFSLSEINISGRSSAYNLFFSQVDSGHQSLSANNADTSSLTNCPLNGSGFCSTLNNDIRGVAFGNYPEVDYLNGFVYLVVREVDTATINQEVKSALYRWNLDNNQVERLTFLDTYENYINAGVNNNGELILYATVKEYDNLGAFTGHGHYLVSYDPFLESEEVLTKLNNFSSFTAGGIKNGEVSLSCNENYLYFLGSDDAVYRYRFNDNNLFKKSVTDIDKIIFSEGESLQLLSTTRDTIGSNFFSSHLFGNFETASITSNDLFSGASQSMDLYNSHFFLNGSLHFYGKSVDATSGNDVLTHYSVDSSQNITSAAADDLLNFTLSRR